MVGGWNNHWTEALFDSTYCTHRQSYCKVKAYPNLYQQVNIVVKQIKKECGVVAQCHN